MEMYGPNNRPYEGQHDGQGEVQHGLSVWATMQRSPAEQRRDWYLPESSWHPDLTTPALAARIITTYSLPGEIVADPMAGIGTTLVEAVRCDRRAVGIEIEPHWAAIARDNLALARHRGAKGYGLSLDGDGRYLHQHTASGWRGAVALVAFTPPRLPAGADREPLGPGKRQPWARRPRIDPTGARMTHDYAATDTDALHDILACAMRILRPGGVLAITARPWRDAGGAMVDLPGDIIATARGVGFGFTKRHVTLQVAIRDGQLIEHRAESEAMSTSETSGHATSRAAHDTLPDCVPAFEDVLVFRRPPKRWRSHKQ
jgi:hypothetical protein